MFMKIHVDLFDLVGFGIMIITVLVFGGLCLYLEIKNKIRRRKRNK